MQKGVSVAAVAPRLLYPVCNWIRFVVGWRIGIWTTKQKKRRVPTLIATRYVHSGRRRIRQLLVDHVNLFSSSYPALAFLLFFYYLNKVLLFFVLLGHLISSRGNVVWV